MRKILSLLILSGHLYVDGILSPALAEDALPRFATLRTDPVHWRAGPGSDYPILWIYRRNGLPVEVFEKFENWRRVRDAEGVEGWVNAALLSRTRHVQVIVPAVALRRQPRADASRVALAERGAVLALDSCDTDWCIVTTLEGDSFSGWVEKTALWGVKPNEVFRRRNLWSMLGL